MVVASHVAGRLRIRDEKMRRESVAGRVRETLEATTGVSSVEVNARVGSVLVIYSAAVTGEDILAVVSKLVGSTAMEEGVAAAPVKACPRISLTIPPRLKRNAANIGMLATLVLSLVAAPFHLKKLHVVAGIAFAALAGDHLYERRQLLFA
ncbi:heavy-metal-associated domain-containing protein [Geobacter sulfurreducens]|uniref:heavy-metal-associated domain-containing protein n=1 Tax=Geobacter sulfurreducens TaxID=35554 RepID=UPI0001E342FC|nr:heavy metal-associated domain-containing protein [Geobacter sulfurreducens]ADI86014.2 hypothetical protein KN400_3202 [Geobacter sulfurreducens KN400]AJY69494.1 hypothetical protein RW64_07650 [Geobacter sulfurreducens]QVW35049.1 heavy-metal-associated domain-containing protein [Geobacter sulfurreducens]